ncbi:uncharacterized protein LOC113667446 [Pocillopora damicornis]|uniref:uncharacterized protein LOC113667446 n=1 Tax=Pocillopora damicornis TaxID=46731 RepID=UPI000F54C87C|nr:uncharacterized protein LOC113667446 [Pocillopora damicornis]
MRVIPNNCVSEIKYPKSIARADGVDYNPVLNLFVTFNYNYDGACVWDSSTGKVLARFDELGENFRDVLFLPGNHLAVSSSEAHHGGCIKICFFEDGKPASVKFVIDSEDLPVDYPGAIALSPGRNLLVSEAFNGGDLYEVLIDWDNLKVLKSREIIPSTEESVEDQILQLSCSQNFDVARFDISSDAILVAKVTEFSTEGKAQTQKQEEITYYVLDGEEKRIASNDGSHVPGLAHDGQNLIIATENEIVLLESATEGSNALLIASGVKPSGQIKINCEGQLMVCEKNAIKLFEYKNEIRSLQSLCRHYIREAISTNFARKENNSIIPSSLKDDDDNADDGDDGDDDDDDDDDDDEDEIREPIHTYYAKVVHKLIIPSSLKDYLLYKSN